MKLYYRTLTKNKKKNIKEIYKKDYQKTDLNNRLIRLSIYSAIGLIFSIILFIDALKDELNIGSLILAITLLIASLVFIIGQYFIKLKTLNKIALKNK